MVALEVGKVKVTALVGPEMEAYGPQVVAEAAFPVQEPAEPEQFPVRLPVILTDKELIEPEAAFSGIEVVPI